MHCLATAQTALRQSLAQELQALPKATRRARVTALVIETGGTLIPQQPRSNRGPVYTELSLMGLYHSGETLDETIANWIKAATRSTDIEQVQQ